MLIQRRLFQQVDKFRYESKRNNHELSAQIIRATVRVTGEKSQQKSNMVEMTVSMALDSGFAHFTPYSYVIYFGRKAHTMTDIINYPTDSMSTTSRSLVSFIDEQWQQHTALFMKHADSYTALLEGIAKVIPGAEGKASDLSNSLTNYQKQYEQCYQALRELAANIDAAAQVMSDQDQQIGSGFQSM